MPHHTDDGHNVVGSQPGHATPDNQSGRLCTGSDISRFESVDFDSDKGGTSSGGASDEACMQDYYSKFGWTNDPPDVMSQNVRD